MPNDGSDATNAITAAIAAARSQNKPLYVPAGTFRISVADQRRRREDLRRRTVVVGAPGHRPQGGFFATGPNVTIADLAIFGDNRARDDANGNAALEGNFGTGSLLQNLWIEHTKVGLWADSGPTACTSSACASATPTPTA